MGKFIKNSKGIGEVTIMEVSSDVDHDLDMATPTKKRKISDGDVKLLSPPLLSLKSKENDELSEPVVSSDKNGSKENSVEDVASTESEEMILSTELRAKSEPESKKMPRHDNSSCRQLPAKMPSENEMEDFFAAYGKDMLKHFKEKYNFDFDKDEPLEGRYEWVRIGN